MAQSINDLPSKSAPLSSVDLFMHEATDGILKSADVGDFLRDVQNQNAGTHITGTVPVFTGTGVVGVEVYPMNRPGITTAAHGLGRVPTVIQIFARCYQNPQFGWVVGDTIFQSNIQFNTSGGGYNRAYWYDVGAYNWTYYVPYNSFKGPRKDASGEVTLSQGSFRIGARLW